MSVPVVGVDIGATNTRVALIEDGALIVRHTMLTEAYRGPADGLHRIGALIEQVIAEAGVTEVRGIGIGATAPVDVAQGHIQNPFTLPTWDDVPIVDFITERFHLPTLLLTDAHVATLGEYHAGAGQGSRNMLYITISTGIGGGIICRRASVSPCRTCCRRGRTPVTRSGRYTLLMRSARCCEMFRLARHCRFAANAPRRGAVVRWQA